MSLAMVVLTLGLLPSSLDRAAANETDRDSNISVDITDGTEPTSTPSPSPTTPTSSPNPTTPPNPPGPDPRPRDSGQQTITDPADADAALGDDPTDIGGILYMSGVTATVSPSFTPANGTVKLTITVRNTSATTFDSTTRFWFDTPLGTRVAIMDDIEVLGLEPGETRRISATFGSLGQHTVLKASARFTPPEAVEGTPLQPLTRDTLVVLPPLFSLSIAGLIALIGGLIWWVLSPAGPGFGWLFGLLRRGS